MPGIEDFGGNLQRRRHRALLAARFMEFDYLAPILGRPRLSHETYLLMAEAAALIDLCEIQYRRMRSAIRRAMSKEPARRKGMTRMGAILIARGEVAIFVGLVHRALQALIKANRRRDIRMTMPPQLAAAELPIQKMRDHFEHAIDRAQLRQKKGRSMQGGNPIFHKAFGIIEKGAVTFGADQVSFTDMPRWLDWMRQAFASHAPVAHLQ
jgi:hypothetical protein